MLNNWLPVQNSGKDTWHGNVEKIPIQWIHGMLARKFIYFFRRRKIRILQNSMNSIYNLYPC